MSNPNNCETCDHKKHPDGGHCYMFRLEPKNPCSQHTHISGETILKFIDLIFQKEVK